MRREGPTADGPEAQVSYSEYVVCNLVDMDSLLGTMLWTVLNYKRDPYVHYKGSLHKVNTDSSSHIPTSSEAESAPSLRRPLGGL